MPQRVISDMLFSMDSVGVPITVDPEIGPYIDREESELEYHARILATAHDASLPLLDRVRFCSFFTRLTDEFFRVRIAKLTDEAVAHSDRSPRIATQLRGLRDRFNGLSATQYALWNDQLAPELSANGIHIVSWPDLTADQRDVAYDVFREEIRPLLTPLAVGPAHPFPFISDLSLSLAVRLDDNDAGSPFARVKVPAPVNRLIQVDELDNGGVVFVRVEEVIGEFVGDLISGRRVASWSLFRITRNADYDVEESEIDDLRREVAAEIHGRRFGEVLRLELVPNFPDDIRELIMRELQIDESRVIQTPNPLDLSAFDELYKLDRPELKRKRPRTTHIAGFEPDQVFGTIQDHDVLVHHPYESFATSTQQFLDAAAHDPRVLAIKQTLYRTSGDSPIAEAAMDAARDGKQTVMLVELKARFDEEANLSWAKRLASAGVHVVHGYVSLKTHTKVALVVRRDEDGRVRRYCNIATGNYNPSTARYYEDLGYFTADPTITEDLGDLFNMLTSSSRGLYPKRLLIAPTTLLPRLMELIDEQAHEGGRIIVKTNHIAHPEIMRALVRASQAGAKVDLIARTTCCLVPGIDGITDNIHIRSVNAPFLEHSRIYKFGDNPEPGSYLIGSADLMMRNLDNRIEAVVPVDSARLRARLDEILTELLADETWSWTMQPDSTWRRVRGKHDAQARLSAAARRRNHLS